MPDDVVRPDSGAIPAAAGGQATPPTGGGGSPVPSNDAPKRRRRRRRKPPVPGHSLPPVQTSDFDTVVQDVEDRMEDPSPSVQAMEEAAKPHTEPEALSGVPVDVPVVPVYQESAPPAAPSVETYSAPIYQDPTSSGGQAPQPIPEIPPAAPIPPLPSSSYDPFGDPFNDPFGTASNQPPMDYSDPMSQPIFPPDEPEPAHHDTSVQAQQPEAPLEGEIVSETLPETLPEPAAPTESLDELAVQGSFNERLEKLLHDANITPRQIKFCCGGLAVIFVLIVAGWFLIPKVLENGLPDFGNQGAEEAVDSPEEPEEPEEQSAPPSVAPLDTRAWVDPSVFVGLSLGNPAAILPGDTGVASGILVGEQAKLDHDFSQLQTFVSDLDALYRLYRADLDALLDAAPSNRTATLDQHLVELRAAYNRNFANYEEIVRIKDSFGDRFNTLQPQKEAAEIDFFNQIRAFEGATAEQQLVQFIDLSRTQVDFKAKYFAFGKLQAMHETILPPFKKRIEDIEYNRAALISDVQVVDVIGSDLDLIVGEEEL